MQAPNLNGLSACSNTEALRKTFSGLAEKEIKRATKARRQRGDDIPAKKEDLSQKHWDEIATKQGIKKDQLGMPEDPCSGNEEFSPDPTSQSCDLYVNADGKLSSTRVAEGWASILAVGYTAACRKQRAEQLQEELGCLNQQSEQIKKHMGAETQKLNAYLSQRRSEAQWRQQALQAAFDQRQKFAEIMGVKMPAQDPSKPPTVLDDATFENSELMQVQRAVERMLTTNGNEKGVEPSIADTINQVEDLQARLPEVQPLMNKRLDALYEAEVRYCMETTPAGFSDRNAQSKTQASSAVDLIAAWAGQAEAYKTNGNVVQGTVGQEVANQRKAPKAANVSLAINNIFNGVAGVRAADGKASVPDHGAASLSAVLRDVLPNQPGAQGSAGAPTSGDAYNPVTIAEIKKRASEQLGGYKLLLQSTNGRSKQLVQVSAYDKFMQFFSNCEQIAERKLSRVRKQAAQDLKLYKRGEQSKLKSLFRKYDATWTTLAKRITRNNETLSGALGKDVETECAKPGPNDNIAPAQLSCLRMIENNFTRMLKGPFNKEMRYGASGGGKIPDVAIGCMSLQECNTKLRNTIANLGDDIRVGQTQHARLLQSANKDVDDMVGSISGQLQSMKDGLMAYMSELNKKLVGMGIDVESKFDTIKGEERKVGPDGIYQPPTDAMAWIGAGMIDFSKDPFKGYENAMAAAVRKSNELTAKAFKKEGDFTSFLRKCEQERYKTILSSAQAQVNALASCGYSERFCEGSDSEFHGLEQAIGALASSFGMPLDGSASSTKVGVTLDGEVRSSLSTLSVGINGICNQLKAENDQNDNKLKLLKSNFDKEGCSEWFVELNGKKYNNEPIPKGKEKYFETCSSLNAQASAIAQNSKVIKRTGEDALSSSCTLSANQIKGGLTGLKEAIDKKSDSSAQGAN